MLINSNLSTDNAALAAFQNQRAAAGSTPSQTSSSSAGSSETGLVDPSSRSLSNVPVNTQDAQWEIQDEQGANHVMDSLRQGMMNQPGAVMSAHTNQAQLFNVLGLLGSAED